MKITLIKNVPEIYRPITQFTVNIISLILFDESVI